MNASLKSSDREGRPLRFGNWRAVLAGSLVSSPLRRDYETAITEFLVFCRQANAAPSIAVAREYLQVGVKPEGAREALRWFFRVGWLWERLASLPKGARERASTKTRLEVPPKASEDLGGADWERDLVKAIRQRGFLWRTEQTYRAWATRFAATLCDKSPSAATADDVAGFLTRLAVEQRASRSTQRQALNALVFLIEEALHRTLGEIPFRRAESKRRVPMVLSVDECGRLLGALEGTPRLMAELAYGSGLRLMELLRLRVHHLDLARGQLKVFAGKGDKDRITVLPQRLVPRLELHLDRLRTVFAEDRREGLPGVWLPEGLARKYPKAGESWEWQWLFPSRETSVDPVTGARRRHHVVDGTFQNIIRVAA